MRKKVLLVLTLVACISLTACTKSKDGNTSDTTSQTESSFKETESNSMETESSSKESESNSDETKNSPAETHASTESTSVDDSEKLVGPMVREPSDVDLSAYAQVDELIFDGSEYDAPLLFTTDQTLKELKFTHVITDLVNYELGEVFYSADEFSPEQALLINAYLPDMSPNLMVSYIDQDGNKIYYFITLNLNVGGYNLVDASSIIENLVQ